MGKNSGFFLFLVCVAFLLACVFVFTDFYFYFQNGKIVKASPVETVLPAKISLPKTFNVLIIPGHEPKTGGGNYKNVYERDLAAEIGAEISDILSANSKFKIVVARDQNNWNPVLQDYFQNEKQQIIDFKNLHQQETKDLMSSGKIKPVPDMGMHAEASPDMSVKLYGMNKWANENNIDLVVNLHFNDEQRPNMNLPGDLKGFVIFTPESQMKNFAGSQLAGQDIFDRLKIIEPPEIGYLLADQTLIALGASDTLNAPSMLIEYAYIYEKKLLTNAGQQKSLDEFARQTALGIENYASGSSN